MKLFVPISALVFILSAHSQAAELPQEALTAAQLLTKEYSIKEQVTDFLGKATYITKIELIPQTQHAYTYVFQGRAGNDHLHCGYLYLTVEAKETKCPPFNFPCSKYQATVRDERRHGGGCL